MLCFPQGAMSAAQVKEAETISNQICQKNDKVYAKETALAQAKAIQGLRAVFDEVDKITRSSVHIEWPILTKANFCARRHENVEHRDGFWTVARSCSQTTSSAGVSRSSSGSGHRCFRGGVDEGPRGTGRRPALGRVLRWNPSTAQRPHSKFRHCHRGGHFKGCEENYRCDWRRGGQGWASLYTSIG